MGRGKEEGNKSELGRRKNNALFSLKYLLKKKAFQDPFYQWRGTAYTVLLGKILEDYWAVIGSIWQVIYLEALIKT